MKNYIEEFDNDLLDLLQIANRTKPGQVTHKLAELKIKYTEAIQSAKKEAVEECIKEIDTIRSSDGSDDYYTAISDVKDKLVEYLEAK